MLWIFWAQVPVAKASLCSPPSRVGSPRSLDLGSLQDANMYPFVPAQSACFVCCFNPHFGVTSTGCWISSLSSSLSIETEISTKRLSHLPCDTRRRLISVLSKLHHRRAAPRWILFDKLEETRMKNGRTYHSNSGFGDVWWMWYASSPFSAGAWLETKVRTG